MKLVEKRHLLAVALTALCWLPSASANAGVLLSSGGGGAVSGLGGPGTVGFSFTVGSAPLAVTALGILDLQSFGVLDLQQSHDVGLWTTGGSLLGSVTIPAGNGPLINGFRFINLGSPVTLTAGQTYVLGAFYLSSFVGLPTNDNWYTNSSAQMAAIMSGDASFVGPRRNVGASLTFPVSVVGTSGYVGPNMQYTAVPEPTSLLLLGGALLLGARRLTRSPGVN